MAKPKITYKILELGGPEQDVGLCTLTITDKSSGQYFSKVDGSDRSVYPAKNGVILIEDSKYKRVVMKNNILCMPFLTNGVLTAHIPRKSLQSVIEAFEEYNLNGGINELPRCLEVEKVSEGSLATVFCVTKQTHILDIFSSRAGYGNSYIIPTRSRTAINVELQSLGGCPHYVGKGYTINVMGADGFRNHEKIILSNELVPHFLATVHEYNINNGRW